MGERSEFVALAWQAGDPHDLMARCVRQQSHGGATLVTVPVAWNGGMLASMNDAEQNIREKLRTTCVMPFCSFAFTPNVFL